MSPRRKSPWKRTEVLEYVIDCYEGVEITNANGIPKPVRQFMWADAAGEVWIGNSAAFAEHLAVRFDYPLLPYDYVNINSLLIDLGERIHQHAKRAAAKPAGQAPLVPRKEKVQ